METTPCIPITDLFSNSHSDFLKTAYLGQLIKAEEYIWQEDGHSRMKDVEYVDKFIRTQTTGQSGHHVGTGSGGYRVWFPHFSEH